MKRLTVIGTGVGEGTLTAEAREAILRADVLLGSPRLLKRYAGGGRAFPRYLPRDVAAVVEREVAAEFALLVSGDVGFYSAASGIGAELGAMELRFLPGVSTVNALFARLGLPWQDAAFVSVHGRHGNVADAVRRNRLAFCLVGNNAREVGSSLLEAGLGHVPVRVGENLGEAEERVYEAVAADLLRLTLPTLAALLFVNEAFDDSAPTGLPDERFLRVPGVPMTKSETRAVVLSKLRLRPDAVCWDVGAGTGSVTVEMALSAYKGHVYAVERREDAVPLIRENCAAFHLGNITAIHGEAPEELGALPPPDAAFIGGSGGGMRGIVSAVLAKNPRARIVVTAVTPETASETLAAFQSAGLAPEMMQLAVCKYSRSGSYHMPAAQNPVTILSAGGEA